MLKLTFFRQVWDHKTVIMRLSSTFLWRSEGRLTRALRSRLHGPSLVVDVSRPCLQVIFFPEIPWTHWAPDRSLRPVSTYRAEEWEAPERHYRQDQMDLFLSRPHDPVLNTLPPWRRSQPIGINAVTLHQEWASPHSLIYDRRDDFQKPRLPLIPSHLALFPVVDVVEPSGEELCPGRRQDILSSVKSRRERTRAAEAYKFILLHQREVILRAHAGN